MKQTCKATTTPSPKRHPHPIILTQVTGFGKDCRLNVHHGPALIRSATAVELACKWVTGGSSGPKLGETFPFVSLSLSLSHLPSSTRLSAATTNPRRGQRCQPVASRRRQTSGEGKRGNQSSSSPRGENIKSKPSQPVQNQAAMGYYTNSKPVGRETYSA